MREVGVNTTTDGILQKLVTVRRTNSVTAGGRNQHFSALMVVGDGQGRVGYGLGRAQEVPAAINKAMTAARLGMVKIELKGNTIQHEIISRFNATKVKMMPASEGTGIIAGNAMRAVFEVLGVQNVLAKCYGSTNPINVVRATVEGLSSMMTAEKAAAKRGKLVHEIIDLDKDKDKEE